MSRPSMAQAPTNEKDFLNTQEVKNFLNLWLLEISLILNYLFNPYSAVHDTSIKTLA